MPLACLVTPLVAIPVLLLVSLPLSWLLLRPNTLWRDEMTEALPKTYPIILCLGAIVILATC